MLNEQQSVQRARAYGMGFIPILIAAASAAYGIVDKKKKEKAAKKEAEKAEQAALEAAKRKKAQGPLGGMSPTMKWVMIGGAVVVVGTAAYFMLRKKRGRS